MEAGIELRVSRTMTAGTDGIARMKSRTLRAEPVEQQSDRVIAVAVGTNSFTVIAGHSAAEDARERAYDPAIHPLGPKPFLRWISGSSLGMTSSATTAVGMKRQRVCVTQRGTPLVEWPG
jgi:hypothetical protein